MDDEFIVEIVETKKDSLIEDFISVRQTVVAKSKNIKSSYMIFALQKIRQKFGIDYDTILVLNYIYELGVFDIRIKVEKRTVWLKNYIALGLIVRDYKVKDKELYCLTDKSNKIVMELNENVGDNQNFKIENREVEVGVDIKVSNALNSYFNR